MVMQAITDLSKEVPIPSMLVEVVNDVDNKKNHDFLETLLVAHPVLGGQSSNWGSDQSSQQLTVTRVSRESN